MIKDIEVPKTIGEFVELLSKYPKDTKLQLYITQLVYGDTSEYQSWKMRVEDDWPDDTIFITFANEHTLS